jgi:hypothetical protein
MSGGQKDEIREALRSLLIDIESMYEGAEASAKGGQPEEFFGPFSVWKMDAADWEARIAVSWPNLAISMRNARDALRNADAESSSS